MDLVARYALGVPPFEQIKEDNDELVLSLDSGELVVKWSSQALESPVLADCDHSDVSVLCSSVEVDVLALRLEAVEESDNGILFGVRKQLSSSVGCRPSISSVRVERVILSSLCSSIARTAMCCGSF